MSIHLIKNYLAEVERTIQFGGTRKETSIRNAFQRLLDDYARQKGLMLIPEISIKTKQGKTITPDGTLKDALRQDWGYWESKDEADDINEEIRKKFAKGYFYRFSVYLKLHCYLAVCSECKLDSKNERQTNYSK